MAVLGGDGSLGCFIDTLMKEETIAENIGRISFTGLPFGTGNDTGRSLGWGGKEGKLTTSLEYIVTKLL